MYGWWLNKICTKILTFAYFVCSLKSRIVLLSNKTVLFLFYIDSKLTYYVKVQSYESLPLADPGGGRTRRAPPNGRGPMIFLCLKR